MCHVGVGVHCVVDVPRVSSAHCVVGACCIPKSVCYVIGVHCVAIDAHHIASARCIVIGVLCVAASVHHFY